MIFLIVSINQLDNKRTPSNLQFNKSDATSQNLFHNLIKSKLKEEKLERMRKILFMSIHKNTE